MTAPQDGLPRPELVDVITVVRQGESSSLLINGRPFPWLTGAIIEHTVSAVPTAEAKHRPVPGIKLTLHARRIEVVHAWDTHKDQDDPVQLASALAAALEAQTPAPEEDWGPARYLALLAETGHNHTEETETA